MTLVLKPTVRIKDLAKRICEECGAKYKPRREHQRFCSTPCRSAAWVAKHPRVELK